MFQLRIHTDNAAFAENPSELSDILSDLAMRAPWGGQDNASGGLKDSNGNYVGAWQLSPEG